MADKSALFRLVQLCKTPVGGQKMERNGEIFLFLSTASAILAIGYIVSLSPTRFRARIFAFLFLVVLLTGFSLSRVSAQNLTAFAALNGALIAALGWVITNIQNRYQNRLQHSANLIHHFTQDPELEFHIVRIRQTFPEIEAIPLAKVEALRADSKNPRLYDVSSKTAFTTPIFYSIVHLLNFFERIAYLYNSGSLDKAMIRRQLNPALAGFLTRFQTVIRLARSGNTKTTAYSDLVRLAREWYGIDLDQNGELDLDVFQKGYLARYGREYA